MLHFIFPEPNKEIHTFVEIVLPKYILLQHNIKWKRKSRNAVIMDPGETKVHFARYRCLGKVDQPKGIDSRIRKEAWRSLVSADIITGVDFRRLVTSFLADLSKEAVRSRRYQNDLLSFGFCVKLLVFLRTGGQVLPKANDLWSVERRIPYNQAQFFRQLRKQGEDGPLWSMQMQFLLQSDDPLLVICLLLAQMFNFRSQSFNRGSRRDPHQ